MGGGASGPEEEAFTAIQEGNCGRALDMAEGRTPDDPMPEPTRTLYEGAGAACLAAFPGRPDLWPRAGSALERLTGRTARLDCLQQAVHGLLERVVAAHRADPGATLEQRTTGPRGELACPRFTRLVPDHGPAAGGYEVRIQGRHLPREVGLVWGEHYLTAVSEDGHSIVVTAPPAAPGEEGAFVVPDGWPYGPANNPSFRYDPPATTTTRTATSQPSSTASTGPFSTSPSSSDPSPPST
jgi:IPT/TIG domain